MKYDRERLMALRERVSKNATECIFPFWTSDYIRDPENGGYYGCVTIDMERNNSIDRSLVLYGRMVYAYSNAYITFGDERYLECAKYTFDYLVDKFWDDEYGGAYSSVTTTGEPANTDKSVYSLAFFVMACAAYYNACRDSQALDLGMKTFRLIEGTKSAPAVYMSNVARDWTEQLNVTGRIVFPKDTIVFPHHLCQAYEQLYIATKDADVLAALRDLAEFLAGPAFDSENLCFTTFVGKDGKRVGDRQSLGHDCEISYLAYDVAELVGDSALTERIKEVCEVVLRQVLKIGFDEHHGLYNSYDVSTGEFPKVHTWWVQAESVMAMLFGYQLTGDEAFLEACEKQLDYIEKYFINEEHGDWYNNIIVDEEGRHIVDGSHGFDKLNAGKCPFHNSHMCFDVMKRVDRMLG